MLPGNGKRARINVEATRDMQTEVLRAFHNWARPADIKFRIERSKPS